MGSLLVRINVNDKGNIAIEKLGKNAEIAEKKIGKTGDTLLKAFGTAASFLGLYKLVGKLGEATEEVQKFQDAMVKLRVVGDLTEKSFASFDKQVVNMLPNVEHLPSSIAKGSLELIKMGYEGEKLQKVLPHALNLATYAGEDFTYTAVNLARTMNVFGKSAEDAEAVSNALGRILNLTALDFQDFMKSMTYAAPIAKNLGYSFEETAVFLGLLSDRSIIGSRAGTGLKNTMLNLIDPAKKLSKAFKGMDVDSMSLTEKLQKIDEAGVSVSDMLKQFKMIALPTALTLRDNTEEAVRLTNALKDMNFSIADASEEIREFSNPMQWSRVWNSILRAGILLNEALGDEQRSLAEKLRRAFVDFGDSVKENEESIRKFARVVERLLGFLINNSETLLKLWGLLWGRKMLSSLLTTKTGITGIGSALGLATKQANLLVGALSRIALPAIGFQGLMDYLTWLKEEEARKGRESAAEGYTKSRVEDLKKIQDLIRSAWLEEFKRSGGQTPSDDPRKIKSSLEIDIYKAMTKYADKYGKIAAEHDLRSKRRLESIILASETRLRGEGRSVSRDDDDDGPPSPPPPRKPLDTDALEKLKKKGILGLIKDGDSDSDSTQAVFNMIHMHDEAADDARKERLKKDIEYFLKSEERREKLKKEADKKQKKREEERREEFKSLIESSALFADSFINLLDVINDAALEKTLTRLDAEKTALQNRLQFETAGLEENSFRRAMLTQKAFEEEKRIDRKMEKARDAAAAKEKRRALFLAGINAAVAATDVLARQPTTMMGKIAAALAIGATATTFIAAIASKKMWAGGIVEGEGNRSSDSVLTWLSKGERVLSNDEIDRVGGHNRLQQIIDNSSNTKTSSKTVIFQNCYGTRQFAREVKELLEKEDSRW